MNVDELQLFITCKKFDIFDILDKASTEKSNSRLSLFIILFKNILTESLSFPCISRRSPNLSVVVNIMITCKKFGIFIVLQRFNFNILNSSDNVRVFTSPCNIFSTLVIGFIIYLPYTRLRISSWFFLFISFFHKGLLKIKSL